MQIWLREQLNRVSRDSALAKAIRYGLRHRVGLGRFLTSALIIIGYSIIVVPTGIYTAELARTMRSRGRVQLRCPQCSLGEHDDDAWFCRKCGEALPHVDNNA